jgi:hypothetical protein
LQLGLDQNKIKSQFWPDFVQCFPIFNGMTVKWKTRKSTEPRKDCLPCTSVSFTVPMVYHLVLTLRSRRCP